MALLIKASIQHLTPRVKKPDAVGWKDAIEYNGGRDEGSVGDVLFEPNTVTDECFKMGVAELNPGWYDPRYSFKVHRQYGRSMADETLKRKLALDHVRAKYKARKIEMDAAVGILKLPEVVVDLTMLDDEKENDDSNSSRLGDATIEIEANEETNDDDVDNEDDESTVTIVSSVKESIDGIPEEDGEEDEDSWSVKTEPSDITMVDWGHKNNLFYSHYKLEHSSQDSSEFQGTVDVIHDSDYDYMDDFEIERYGHHVFDKRIFDLVKEGVREIDFDLYIRVGGHEPFVYESYNVRHGLFVWRFRAVELYEFARNCHASTLAGSDGVLGFRDWLNMYWSKSFD